MNEHELPADDLLMHYANDTLPAAERAAVAAWLRDHPAWEPRVALHRSLGDAVRRGTADAGPTTSFSALWAHVEDRAGGDVVPLGPTSPTRRRMPWLAAVAGAIAAALVAVLVLIGPGSAPEPPAESVPVTDPTGPVPSTSTTPPSTTAGTAPTASVGVQAVRDAVAASRAQGTARGRLQADVSLVDAADIAGAAARGLGPAGQVTGTAGIEFPDRWSLETVTMVEPIEAYAGAQITQGLVGSGSSLQVHCGTGLVPLVDIAAADCPVVPLGTIFLSPTGVFDVIETADDVVSAFETSNGGPGRRYSFRVTLAIGDAEPTEIDVDVDVLDDSNVIEMVQARTRYRATPDTGLLDLWLTWTFDSYGDAVTVLAG